MTTQAEELTTNLRGRLHRDEAWTVERLRELPSMQTARLALYALNRELLDEAGTALARMAPERYREWVVASRTDRAAIDRRLEQLTRFEASPRTAGVSAPRVAPDVASRGRRNAREEARV